MHCERIQLQRLLFAIETTDGEEKKKKQKNEEAKQYRYEFVRIKTPASKNPKNEKINAPV